MSRENVEIVRGYYEVLSRWLDNYWANPVALDETPDEVIEPSTPTLSGIGLSSRALFGAGSNCSAQSLTGLRPSTTGGSRPKS
jgi:hypothetical protein